jgi:hypothetical protein
VLKSARKADTVEGPRIASAALFFKEVDMRRAAFLAALFALALSLSGCQKLFTTSLASSLARPSAPIAADISAADAATLINSPSTSQEELASLLAALNTQAEASDASTETKALAAEAAIGASGVSETVTSTLSSVVSDPSSVGASTANSLIASLQGGATPQVVTALERLGDKETLDTAKESMSATELTVAAMILVADAVPAGTTDISTLSTEQTATLTASPQVAVAQALLAAAAEKIAATGGTDTLGISSLLSQFVPGSSQP